MINYGLKDGINFEFLIHINHRARKSVKAEEAKTAPEAGIESDAAPTAEEDQQG